MAKAQAKPPAPAKTDAVEQQTAQAQLPVEYSVRIFGAKDSGTQRATATVDINGVFAIRGIKVMEGSKGVFVSMPQFKAGNGEYKDTCFPCTKESREQFNSIVLGAYEQALTLKQNGTQTRQQAPQPEQAQTMTAPTM